ncbi:MAG: DUF4286 family protein [Dysgonamonadaceae bacterium]
MIVFNTTFHVSNDVKDDFIEYMLQEFIPASTKSGLLAYPRLACVHGKDSDEGVSFAMEFIVSDLFTLELWNKEESAAILQPLFDKFKEKIAGFTTILETIDY